MNKFEGTGNCIDLKIAVNTKHLIKGKIDGIGRFTHEVFKRLCIRHPETEFHFLFDRPFDTEFVFEDNVKPFVLRPRTVHPILFNYWHNVAVKNHLKKYNVDVFVSPDGFIPQKITTPTLSVIHDLNFEHLPDKLPGKITRMYRKNFPKFAESATRIATVSTYSKNDIINTYDVDAEKIDVVYNGGEQFLADNDEKHENLNHDQPYFIYIGSIHPRKNVDMLLRAFDKFKESDESGHKLLIVGKNLWNQSHMEQIHESMKYTSSVKLLGRLPDNQVAGLLKNARILIFVSLFEGFGIPVLEAMQMGVPVIASKTTSIPEVAGEAAILVDPLNINEIADAIQKLASSKNLRDELIAKGLEQGKKYSWDNTTELFWKSIIKTIG